MENRKRWRHIIIITITTAFVALSPLFFEFSSETMTKESDTLMHRCIWQNVAKKPKHAMHNKSNIESVRGTRESARHTLPSAPIVCLLLRQYQNIKSFEKPTFPKHNPIRLWPFYRALTVTTLHTNKVARNKNNNSSSYLIRTVEEVGVRVNAQRRLPGQGVAGQAARAATRRKLHLYFFNIQHLNTSTVGFRFRFAQNNTLLYDSLIVGVEKYPNSADEERLDDLNISGIVWNNKYSFNYQCL